MNLDNNIRVNLGCGPTCLKGWKNYDNSISAKLAKFPLVSKVLLKTKIINCEQYNMIIACRKNNITYADATKRIPLPDNSASCVYSSHMLEHVSRGKLMYLFKEIKRVLKPGGIIRIGVPDLDIAILNYKKDEDADKFMSDLLMEPPTIETFKDKIKLLLIGYRQHQWMYNKKSIVSLLEKNGLKNVHIKNIGETNINDHKELNLFERSKETVYVEGFK